MNRTLKLLLLLFSLMGLMFLLVVFVDPWLRFGPIPSHWIPEWAGVFVTGAFFRSITLKVPVKLGATVGFTAITFFICLAYLRNLDPLDSLVLVMLLLSFPLAFAAGYLYWDKKIQKTA
jgi:hypothetical protein